VAKSAKKHRIPVLLDAFKDIQPVIETGVDILKINVEELKKLTGCDSLENGIEYCFSHYPVKIAAITAGSENAYLATPDKLWEYRLPAIDQVRNPLGAGDTASAVLFSEYITGTALPEAFANALAAASASCLTFNCGEFSLETAGSLREKIVIS